MNWVHSNRESTFYKKLIQEKKSQISISLKRSLMVKNSRYPMLLTVSIHKIIDDVLLQLWTVSETQKSIIKLFNYRPLKSHVLKNKLKSGTFS